MCGCVEGFGRFWKRFGRLWKVLEEVWKALEGLGRFWRRFGRNWKDLEGIRNVWVCVFLLSSVPFKINNFGATTILAVPLYFSTFSGIILGRSRDRPP